MDFEEWFSEWVWDDEEAARAELIVTWNQLEAVFGLNTAEIFETITSTAANRIPVE